MLFTFMIYMKQWKRWIVYLGFLIFLTGSEKLAVIFNKVKYDDHWNIIYTCISYLLGLILVDIYFHFLKKLTNEL